MRLLALLDIVSCILHESLLTTAITTMTPKDFIEESFFSNEKETTVPRLQGQGLNNKQPRQQ